MVKFLAKLSLGCVILGLVAPQAFADGMFIPPKSTDDITEPQQKAVLMCDAGQERMALSVSYSGSIANFAWIVPTPARPTVTAGSYKLFEELNDNFGAYKAPQGVALNSPGRDETKNEVIVLERKKIDVYDVSVLEARDAQALINWLQTNGYAFDPANTGVIQGYLNNGWYFTALKVAPSEVNSDVVGKLKNGSINPLIFDFASTQCIYPLKISSINKNTTNILVYALSKDYLIPNGNGKDGLANLSLVSYNKLSDFTTHLYDATMVNVLPYLSGFACGTGNCLADYILSKFHSVVNADGLINDLILTPSIVSNPWDNLDNYNKMRNFHVNDVDTRVDLASYIEYLTYYGIEKNCIGSECPFNMNDRITRGDFTRFVVKTVIEFFPQNQDFKGVTAFPDVIATDKNYSSIMLAKKIGLLGGYKDGNFYPNKDISRGEAMKIIARALNYRGRIDFNAIDAMAGVSFYDVPKTHEFYKYIVAAYKLGIISGYPNGGFQPAGSITRGESAKVVVEGKVLIKN